MHLSNCNVKFCNFPVSLSMPSKGYPDLCNVCAMTYFGKYSVRQLPGELPRGDCFADSTPLGFNTTKIPHFQTQKKYSKLGAVAIRP